MKETLNPYEGIVIVNPDVPLDVQKDLFRRNKKIIEAHSGTVNHLETWGKRPLANMINKFDRGLFFHTTFYSDNKGVSELERTMRINDHVLRFVHTRLEDGTDLVQFVEQFKKDIQANIAREKDREAKQQKKQSQKRFDDEGLN